MNIISEGIYKDGGSLSLKTDEGELVVNRRIGDHQNHGKITVGYSGQAVSQDTARQVVDAMTSDHESWYREQISKYHEL